jgi:hypothetical protein
MKTLTLSTFALIGLAAISAPVQLAAQSIAVRVDVPFDFSVGTHSYAAGRYMLSSQSEQAILMRSADGKTASLALGLAVEDKYRESRPRLVFQHMGETYCLSQVWGASSIGRQLWLPKVKTPVIAKAETVTLYAAAN